MQRISWWIERLFGHEAIPTFKKRNRPRRASAKLPLGHRALRIEDLEERRMLSVNASFGGNVLHVWGSAANDTISISYSGGNAVVTGQSGFNFSTAASGVQEILVEGNGGDDSIDLSGVNATDFTSLTDVSIYGDHGPSLVVVAEGVFDPDGNDTIVGSHLADTISGGRGNDTIHGGDGADSIYGGDGNDSLYGESGNDSLYGDVYATGDFAGILPDDEDPPGHTPWNYDRSMDPSTDGPQLDGGPWWASETEINLTGGNDVLSGGDGNDLLIGDYDGMEDGYRFLEGDWRYSWEDGGGGFGQVTMYLDFYDEVTLFGGNDQLDGGTGNDDLQGEGGNDSYTFAASAGEDSVAEAASVDTDTLDFSAFTTGVTLNLSTTTQQTYNSSNKLTLSTSTGIENIKGSSAADSLTGNSRDNEMWGNQGSDSLSGSAGVDTIHGGYQDDSILGGDGNDLLYGDDDSDTIEGGNNDDLVDGGNGNDILYGEAGTDTIIGGADIDPTLNGGAGDDIYKFAANDASTGETVVSASNDVDTIDLSAFSSAVTINLALTSQQTVGTGLKLTLSDGTSFSNVTCGSGNDTLIGNARANTLNGGGGADEIHGMNGDDTINGDGGNDTLYGGFGNDTIHGNDGNDYVYGGEGDDTLYGDDGDDYVYGDAHTGAYLDESLYTAIPGEYSEWQTTGPLAGNAPFYELFGPYNHSGGDDTLYGGNGDDHLVGDYGGLGTLYQGGFSSYSGYDWEDTYWSDIYRFNEWTLLEGTDTINGGSGSNTTSE